MFCYFLYIQIKQRIQRPQLKAVLETLIKFDLGLNIIKKFKPILFYLKKKNQYSGW